MLLLDHLEVFGEEALAGRIHLIPHLPQNRLSMNDLGREGRSRLLNIVAALVFLGQVVGDQTLAYLPSAQRRRCLPLPLLMRRLAEFILRNRFINQVQSALIIRFPLLGFVYHLDQYFFSILSLKLEVRCNFLHEAGVVISWQAHGVLV